jgi:cytochrome c oxidase subunit II
MKTWIPRIWIALLLVLFAVSIPSCLGSGQGDGGFLNFHGKQSAFDAQGPLARQQIDTFYLTLWVSLFLFVTVGGTYLLAIWKFRLKKGDDPDVIPPQSHGHPLIEVGLVVISAGLLVVIAIPTFSGIVLMKRIPPHYAEEDILHVTVIGYQWWFNFEYPDEGFYSSNELVIPAGRPVQLKLVTRDVLHSFWLPKLSGKTDLIAGQTNEMWIKADEPGYFWGQCAEFCGDSHAYMLFRAVALPEAEYQEWVAQQKTATVEGLRPLHLPEGMDPALVERGTELFQSHCAGCHMVDSTRMNMGAPNLAHFGSRSSIAAGWFENDWEDGHGNSKLFEWIRHSDKVKPGNFMHRGFIQEDGRSVVPGMEGLEDREALSDDDVHALVAYLKALKHPAAKQYNQFSDL